MQLHTALRSVLIGSVIALVLMVSACGNADGSSGDDNTTGEMRIAFLAAASGNRYVDSATEAAKDHAAELGVTLTVFDAQFDPQKQLSQCLDAVTQGFDAIVALPAGGVPLIPCAAQAKAADIPLVGTNEPIGTSTTSGEPEVDGVTAQVLTPLTTVAEGQVAQVVAACADADPCDVVFLSAAKLLPAQDTAFQEALETASEDNPNIKVTQAEAGADRAGGLKAMQDVLQRVVKPTVVTAPNTEPIEGAALALVESGFKLGTDVKIVANGATTEQVAKVKSGEYFASYVQLPMTTQELALEYALNAASGETFPTWTDAHTYRDIPLYITQDNVGDLEGFTGEW